MKYKADVVLPGRCSHRRSVGDGVGFPLSWEARDGSKANGGGDKRWCCCDGWGLGRLLADGLFDGGSCLVAAGRLLLGGLSSQGGCCMSAGEAACVCVCVYEKYKGDWACPGEC